MRETAPSGEVLLLDQTPMALCARFWRIVITLAYRMASRRRNVLQVTALSAVDGSVLDYHGFNG